MIILPALASPVCIYYGQRIYVSNSANQLCLGSPMHPYVHEIIFMLISPDVHLFWQIQLDSDIQSMDHLFIYLFFYLFIMTYLDAYSIVNQAIWVCIGTQIFKLYT